ncbi:MAG: MCE family protein [Bacteroidetes bacterium]|nr:MAG: MCE family protein [Bacteroidota bacterium]
MANETFRNIRLGAFVIIGTVFLIAALYLIGNKQNLFGNTFRISAKFYNVGGLMAGNNVRFAGIDVGTVERVEIVNDSSVNVVMVIEKDIQSFIKKNAIASVGTDGLMGNRLININSARNHAESVEEGDELQTLRPIEQDEMVRTLNETNENMKAITSNLRTITDRINSKNTMWSLLMDTVIADNVKAAIVSVKIASNSSAVLTGNLKSISEDIRNGKGSLGALITDTTLSGKIRQIIVKLDGVSDTAAFITGDFSRISKRLEQGQGSVGVLLKDTSFIHHLNTSINNINKGTIILNEDLEALRHSWPFKKYFKKKKK